MTVHIGTLGTTRAAIDADFDWFGTRIRVHPDASDLAYTDFLTIARDIKVDEVTGQPQPGMEQRAAAAVDDMLTGVIHPDDVGEFMRIAKANRQQLMDLMMVSQQIVGSLSGFPTGQPSDSRTGVSGGTARSQGGSSDRASQRKASRKQDKAAKRRRQEAQQIHEVLSPSTVEPPSRHAAMVTTAMRRLDGRPDLQLMVMRREEETSAASA